MPGQYPSTYIVHTKPVTIININNRLPDPTFPSPLRTSTLYFLSKFPCSVCCLIKKLDTAAEAANPNAATQTPLKLST